MESKAKGSVSHWIEGLREGDSLAAQELWSRYFSRLATVAQVRLDHLAREASGQDIALSVLKSVMIGVRENRFPKLIDRDSLWPLLVTLAARKSVSEQRRQLAQKRSRAIECSLQDLQDYIGTEPTPEFATEVADELERLVHALGEPKLRRIVELKLSGATSEEIGEEIGCSKRTVIRKLNLIRQEWREASLSDVLPDGGVQ